MSLTLNRYRIDTLAAGDTTRLLDHCLQVDCPALAEELRCGEPCIEDCRIRLAHPGDNIRIVCVKDVIEPRAKMSGASPGSGDTAVLDGVAVVSCGPIVGFQEGIIDLCGPGADYTRFAHLQLVVLELRPRPDTTPHEHEAVLRRSGYRLAERLAAVCHGQPPDVEQHLTLALDERGMSVPLPRIAYLDLVLAQGLLHDTYVQGRYAGEVLPMSIDPLLAIDSAVVSGNCVSACDKNTTYHHQNNPIVMALLRGHGQRWRMAGMVLGQLPTRLGQKQDCAAHACELLRALEPDGVVISKEGFGNPDADLMLVIDRLESAGLPCVALTDEFAGADGASQSLADTSSRAISIVSTGNANQRVLLPPMRTTIGPLPDVQRLSGGYPYSLRPDGSLEVELQAIIGATNEMGFESLSCEEI
ncbi:MAG: beta-aspartyl-peptidase [Gammaproteobacteria bacterium]|nr:beta-aspartyl-peptidase [Gammaproteobacteria bacterium]